MNLSARNKLLLTTLALAVGLVVIAALVLLPQINQSKELDEQIEAARAEVQAQETLLAQRQSMKNGAAGTSAELLSLGTVMPDNPELPSLVIELQDTAYASGVKLTSVAPQLPTPSADGKYNIIALDISVAGTWADTVDFLQRLNRLTRGVRVLEFASAVAAQDEKSTLPLYSVQSIVKLQTYSYNTASAAATSAAPPPVPAD